MNEIECFFREFTHVKVEDAEKLANAARISVTDPPGGFSREEPSLGYALFDLNAF